MILADTSIWVDHFRKNDPILRYELGRGNIAIHPFIVAELVLGNLPERQKTSRYLDLLPTVKQAQTSEVRTLIESHKLFQRGIGLVDAHLLASTLLTPHTALWSRDKRLSSAAEALGLSTKISS